MDRKLDIKQLCVLASWSASVVGWQWARSRLSLCPPAAPPAALPPPSTERCGAVGVGPEEGREDAQSGTAALPWHRSPTAISLLITVTRGTNTCLRHRPAPGVGPNTSKGDIPRASVLSASVPDAHFQAPSAPTSCILQGDEAPVWQLVLQEQEGKALGWLAVIPTGSLSSPSSPNHPNS